MKQKLLFFLSVFFLFSALSIRVKTKQIERHEGIEINFKASFAYATNPMGCYTIFRGPCYNGNTCGDFVTCTFNNNYGPPYECTSHNCDCNFQPRECVN
jgi:hypothetical protein